MIGKWDVVCLLEYMYFYGVLVFLTEVQSSDVSL